MEQSTELLGNPSRCVHIADRESDIYELFCTAKEIGTHFLVRTCVNRLTGDGRHTVADEMKKIKSKGLHKVNIIDKNGKKQEIVLELKYHNIKLLPPIGKQKKYPELQLTVIRAEERGAPKDRKKLFGN